MAILIFSPLPTILDLGCDEALLGLPNLPTECLPALAAAGIGTAAALAKMDAVGLAAIMPDLVPEHQADILAEAKIAAAGDTDYDPEAMTIMRVTRAGVPADTLRKFFKLGDIGLQAARSMAEDDMKIHQRKYETVSTIAAHSQKVKTPVPKKPKAPVVQRQPAAEAEKERTLTLRERRELEWEEERKAAEERRRRDGLLVKDDTPAPQTPLPIKADLKAFFWKDTARKPR